MRTVRGDFERGQGIYKRHHDKEGDERGSELLPVHSLETRTDTAGGGHTLAVHLCTLVCIVFSIERMAMSVALLPMSLRYGWSDSVKGAVSSSFSAGHIISNLYGGVLASSLSPKLVLSGGILLWSTFVLLTPFAAPWLPLLLLVRAVMGIGEGVAIPCMQVIIKGCVPVEKRGQSLSLVYSGHSMGSIISLMLTPVIVDSYGVASAFMLYAVLGMLLLCVWEAKMGGGNHTRHTKVDAGQMKVKGSDASLPTLSESAVNNTAAEAATSSPPSPPLSSSLGLMDLPWRSFLSNRTFWAVLNAHVTFGICINMCVAWLPTYYAQEFKLDLKNSSFLSVLPWAVMATCTNISGWLADYLIRRKLMSTTTTRKLLQLVGNLGPAICLTYLALVPKSSASVLEATMLVTLCLGTTGIQAAGFASVHTDISTKYAPVLFGITNAASSLAGCIFVYLVGIILDTLGSWSFIFKLVALSNFASAVIFTSLASSEQQFD